MPSSICFPPAASGPVRTVRKPMRIGSPCACAGWDRASAAAAASEDNNSVLRIGSSFIPGLQLVQGVDIRERLRFVVESDLDDVESRVPGVDLAAAVLQEIREVIEHAAPHD